MQVKLGNFDTAERFEDMSSTLYLRGASEYFSLPSIWKNFNEGTGISAEEALLNDYHCLCKTFEWAKKELNLSPESLFSELTEDINNMKESFTHLVEKWM